jgi:hypothetical protein
VKPYTYNLLMRMAEKVAGFTVLRRKISLAQSGYQYNRMSDQSFARLQSF